MAVVTGTIALAFLQTAASQAAEPPKEKAVLAVPPPITIDRPGYYSREDLKPNQKVVPSSRYQNWVRSRDYPREARAEKRSGQTTIRLAIDDMGSVDGCTVTKSSGHADLDQAACDTVSSRARFRPATNAEAEPVASTYDHTVTWKIRETKKADNAESAMADAEIAAEAVAVEAVGDYSYSSNRPVSLPKAPSGRTGNWTQRGLNDYPDGALERRSAGRVRVALSIDKEGKVTACEVVEPSDDEELNRESCSRTDELTDISPALDINGQPTEGRMVRTVSWWLPKDEEIVYSDREYRRGPERFPFFDNMMIGATIEAKADGTVISCRLLKEGKLPKEVDELDKMCDEFTQRGIYFVDVNDLNGRSMRKAELDPLGAKIRVEFRMTGTRVDNAETPVGSKSE